MAKPRGPRRIEIVFPGKLRTLLDSVESMGLTHVASWVANGKAFAIHNPDLFVQQLFPTFFPKIAVFDTFKKQLTSWGFKQLNTPVTMKGLLYFHEFFDSNREEDMVKIERVQALKARGVASSNVTLSLGDHRVAVANMEEIEANAPEQHSSSEEDSVGDDEDSDQSVEATSADPSTPSTNDPFPQLVTAFDSLPYLEEVLEDTAQHVTHLETTLQDLEAASLELQRRKEQALTQLTQAKMKKSHVQEKYNRSALLEDNPWNDKYRQLMEYKRIHGDCLVPTMSEDVEIKALGKWVRNQRDRYKRTLAGDVSVAPMKQEKIDALNRIGFVWNTLDRQWDLQLEQLIRHYETHGTWDVPKRENHSLWRFVNTARRAMKSMAEGDGNFYAHLSDERVKKLNDIGFDWNNQNARQVPARESFQFDEYFRILADFKEDYGHLHISTLERQWRHGKVLPIKNEYRKLLRFMAFINKQHKLYTEGRPSLLDEEKVNRLTELGVEWKRPSKTPIRKSNISQSKQAQWMESFNRFKQFIGENNTFDIPKNEEHSQLRSWVRHQKQQYRNHCNGKHNRLTEERLALLRSIGFIEEENQDSGGAVEGFAAAAEGKIEEADVDVDTDEVAM